jgi:hypothetical protein
MDMKEIQDVDGEGFRESRQMKSDLDAVCKPRKSAMLPTVSLDEKICGPTRESIPPLRK